MISLAVDWMDGLIGVCLYFIIINNNYILTFYRLSNMKASWKGMSREVQNSLLVAIEAKCKDMNDQNISNTLYR